MAEGLATLFPGYFALVMATGIVSVAAKLVGFDWIASVLLWVNLAAYAWISIFGAMLHSWRQAAS